MTIERATGRRKDQSSTPISERTRELLIEYRALTGDLVERVVELSDRVMAPEGLRRLARATLQILDGAIVAETSEDMLAAVRQHARVWGAFQSRLPDAVRSDPIFQLSTLPHDELTRQFAELLEASPGSV